MAVGSTQPRPAAWDRSSLAKPTPAQSSTATAAMATAIPSSSLGTKWVFITGHVATHNDAITFDVHVGPQPCTPFLPFQDEGLPLG